MNEITVGLVFAEDSANTNGDDLSSTVAKITEDLRTGLGHHISLPDMGKMAESFMSGPLKDMVSHGVIDGFSIDIHHEPDEMKVVRDVLEQPLDVLHADVKLQMTLPLEIVSCSFVLDTKTCPSEE